MSQDDEIMYIMFVIKNMWQDVFFWCGAMYKMSPLSWHVIYLLHSDIFSWSFLVKGLDVKPCHYRVFYIHDISLKVHCFQPHLLVLKNLEKATELLSY